MSSPVESRHLQKSKACSFHCPKQDRMWIIALKLKDGPGFNPLLWSLGAPLCLLDGDLPCIKALCSALLLCTHPHPSQVLLAIDASTNMNSKQRKG